jgi:AAA+ ATPase superfamily predicted ATPase
MNNPFRPGAGHQPPYLAGRNIETKKFEDLLQQDIILQNVILTGLRGIGKTVLLESYKPLANKARWLWAGTDCSESASVSEQSMALRLITDIALITSNIGIETTTNAQIGFVNTNDKTKTILDFNFLTTLYSATPGLVSDKLKKVLEIVWNGLKDTGIKGVIFAYDEAQTLSDHAEDRQYPLSLLLDVFQSIQKKGIPFMLVLTGLPTLLTKLVETRTYTERLFSVIMLDRLNEQESRDAILKPFQSGKYTFVFDEETIKIIIKQSGGYPYFIQFICKEIYDIFTQNLMGGQALTVPVDAILQKLDNDFFLGRWAKATDRERELMTIIAESLLSEFSINEIMNISNDYGGKPFARALISQMFRQLISKGLIFKNRRGKYSFAVPLLEGFILRQKEPK